MKERKPKQHYIDNFGWNSCCAALSRKCTCPSWYRIINVLPGANFDEFVKAMEWIAAWKRQTVKEEDEKKWKDIFENYLLKLEAEADLERKVQSLGHIDLWD